MTTLSAILRSVWTRVALVALLVLLIIGRLTALLVEARRGRAASEQLVAAAKKDELVAQHFLAGEQLRVQDLEAKLAAVVANRDGLLAVGADVQAELERLRKAAPGSTTVAVVDLHTGPVVAGGRPSPPAAPAGQGGAGAGSSAAQGHTSTASAPSCSVLEGEQLDLHAAGPVERSPEGVDVWVLGLEVKNLTSGGLVTKGIVHPDLSHVWTAPPPPPPEQARPSGWMLTALYGRRSTGGASWEGLVHTPAWRVPLLGVPARAAAGAAMQPRPDGKGIEAAGAVGISVEFTRWQR